MHALKKTPFSSSFLGTVISLGPFITTLVLPSIQSPGGRVAGAERKRFISRNHVVWLGDFGGPKCLEMRGFVLGENKMRPNDQSSKRSLPNGVREKNNLC